MMHHWLVCEHCHKKLDGIVTHIISGVFCNEECLAAYSKGRRPIRDNPQA